MMCKNNGIQVTTDPKDWEDFFAPESDIKDPINTVDSYQERVRVACELSGRKITKTNQRLDAATDKKKIRFTVEFEFDR